jgi:hypothetical protein
MKPISAAAFLVLLCGAGAIGDDQSDREKLIGSWELQGAPGDGTPSGWIFSEQGSSLGVTQLEGTRKIANFECGVDGVSCEIKESGNKVKVSFWFNGPKLVQLETKGSGVVKRRFAIVSQADVMDMEVIPIVPSGKTETFRFKRVQPSALGK